MPSIGRPAVRATVSASSSAEQTVTVPQVSVSPYAVSTSGKSSARILRTRATGTSEAPVTASRSDERSNRSRPGASSSSV